MKRFGTVAAAIAASMKSGNTTSVRASKEHERQLSALAVQRTPYNLFVGPSDGWRVMLCGNAKPKPIQDYAYPRDIR